MTWYSTGVIAEDVMSFIAYSILNALLTPVWIFNAITGREDWEVNIGDDGEGIHGGVIEF